MPIWFVMALMALSALAKKKAQGQIQDEQGRVSSLERQRQNQLEQEKQATIQSALPQAGRAAQEADHNSIAQKIQSFITPQAANAPAPQYADTNQGGPKEIKDKEQAVMDAAAQKGQQYAARLADTSAYNLMNFNTGTMLNRVGEKTGEVNTAQSRSSQILPFELQAATRAGNTQMMLGDVLQGAAMIGGAMGTGGAAAEGAAAGGSGVTANPGVWDRMVPAGQGGLNPNAAGQGLRAPGVPRLVF